MSTKLQELKQQILSLDEITVLEMLEISTEDLVDRFEDKIEDKILTLERDLL